MRAYTDIQTALDAAKANDTVIVDDGVYDLTYTVTVTNAITLKSANGLGNIFLRREGASGVTDPTIRRVVCIGHKDAVVDGFAITGGCLYWNNNATFAEDRVGAGVLIGAAGGTLRNCSVTNNVISRHIVYGGGVGALSADAVVTNCLIALNDIGTSHYTQRGIGVYMKNGARLLDSVISNNCLRVDVGGTENSGGGVYSDGGLISGCTIVGNRCHSGGGVYVNGGTVIVDSTFSGNRTTRYSGDTSPSLKGGGLYANGAAYVTNCTFAANAADGTGGGLYNASKNSIFSNVSFLRNRAYNSTSATDPEYHDASAAKFVDCTTWDPTADPAGPAELTVVHPDAAEKPAGAYTDLFAAVAAAGRGTTIRVGPGNYLLSGQLLLDKGVKLVSTDGAEKTILRRKVTRNTTYQTNRVVRIAHPEARVEGFAITGGWVYHYYGVNCDYSGGGVLIEPQGGSLVSCVVTNNGAARYNGRGMGAAVYGRNALVSNCVFAANTDAGQYYSPMMGYGVYATSGAKITHSVFTNNVHTGSGLGTVYLLTGASLSHSIVRKGTMSQGAGVYVGSSDCVVDNCLVADCTASGNAGGVYAGNGTLVNCTIADNSSGAAGGGVYAEASAHIVNTLLSGNAAVTAGTEQWGGSASAVYSNCFANVDFTSASHGCVKDGDAAFEEGGYALTSSSPCIDKGWDDALAHAVQFDLAGTNRYSKTIDIGAYEYQYEAFSASIGISTPMRVTGEDYTFACAVKLAEEAPLAYRWRVDGGAYGEETSANTFTTSFATAGSHTVDCLVSVDGVWRENPVSFATTVAPKTLYVVNAALHPGHVPAAPYDTEDTAATNVLDAVAAANYGSTVRVGPGVYPLDDTVELTTNIRIVGTDGAAKTELRRTPVWPSGTETLITRCLVMNHALSRVEGLTISGGLYYTWATDRYDVGGAGVFIDSAGGTLDSCVVTNCWAARHIILGAGVLVQSAQGVVTNCLIAHNHGDGAGAYTQRGGGIYVGAGGLLTHSTVSDNVSNGSNQSYCGGVYLSEGTVNNCYIVRNVQKGAAHGGGGLYVGGPDTRVVNTLVADNTATGPGGGVCFTDDNVWNSGESVVVNCTVVSNGASSAGGVRFTRESGQIVRNCIVSANTNKADGAASDFSATKGVVTYTLSPDETIASGTGNLIGSPVFRANGRLGLNSPGFDAGLYEDWMANATDLLGKPRATDRHKVDMGATQANHGGMILIIR